MGKTLLSLCLCLVLIHSQITLLQPVDKNENPKPTYGEKKIIYSETIVTQLSLEPEKPLSKYQPKEKRITGDVAGIILSFKNGYSYDDLFSTVEQKSKDGSVVLTFVANASS